MSGKTRNVVVTVLGTQRDALGEENRIELVTSGKYYRSNDVSYISYKESEGTGMEGTTTMLKVYDEYVVLSRSGSVDYQQEFRLGEKCQSFYRTPYGKMVMSVTTTQVNISFAVIAGFAATIGNFDIEYELEIDGAWQSANTLSITVQEEKCGH